MWHQRSWVRIPSSTQKPMQTHRLFLCKTGFKAAQHGVLGVFCLIRTELARGRKKQKCPKMPQALSCDSPATIKPGIAYHRLLRAPAASGNGNGGASIPPTAGVAESRPVNSIFRFYVLDGFSWNRHFLLLRQFLQFTVGTHPSQSYFQLGVPPTMQQICSVVGTIPCWKAL